MRRRFGRGRHKHCREGPECPNQTREYGEWYHLECTDLMQLPSDDEHWLCETCRPNGQSGSEEDQPGEDSKNSGDDNSETDVIEDSDIPAKVKASRPMGPKSLEPLRQAREAAAAGKLTKSNLASGFETLPDEDRLLMSLHPAEAETETSTQAKGSRRVHMKAVLDKLGFTLADAATAPLRGGPDRMEDLMALPTLRQISGRVRTAIIGCCTSGEALNKTRQKTDPRASLR